MVQEGLKGVARALNIADDEMGYLESTFECEGLPGIEAARLRGDLDPEPIYAPPRCVASATTSSPPSYSQVASMGASRLTSKASKGALPAKPGPILAPASHVASTTTSSPPPSSRVASMGTSRLTPKASKGALSTKPVWLGPSPPSQGKLVLTSSRLTRYAHLREPEYPGVMLGTSYPGEIDVTYDLSKEVPHVLPDGRRYLSTFYLLRVDNRCGPYDKVWIHDFNPTDPGVATIGVVRRSAGIGI